VRMSPKLSDDQLDALARAVARQKAAEAALEQSTTADTVREAAAAKFQLRAMRDAALPSILAEIAELRRLLRIYAPEHVP
jgi:hypothetical protein